MVTVFDVDPQVLINRAAKELKNNEKVNPTEWAKFVKTGPHKQKVPNDPDWWFVRAAAILRTVYIKGPIGVSKLRTKYGGKVFRSKSVRPQHTMKASGSIIRKILQQLEAAGYLEKESKSIKRGRKLTGAGRKFLDNISKDITPAKTAPKPEEKKTGPAPAEAPVIEEKEEKPKTEEPKQEVKVNK
ncbi:30S ribosomal protein S19e [Candidatus Woesearchaeota archaeon]|nr:30S ribosomal protein S19e [Candidatus Woesearchaeota archaeon]